MAPSDLNALLRTIPSVDEVLSTADARTLQELMPRSQVVQAVRAELDAVRADLLADPARAAVPDDLSERIARRARKQLVPSLRPVINATGVIVHTNLGRSALAPSALAAVQAVAAGYSTLEYDTDAMARGSRHSHCEGLICALTGAEAAIAVNNNAAAVLMVLSEFAAGREAVVSRGELVEIGGSFRIPDIMRQSGARMVEVGTTNKTHAADYEQAITPDTAMLLKVHTSNYRIVGFSEAVTARELRRIANRALERRSDGDPNNRGELLVYEDLGSGALLASEALRADGELTAGEALANGCDLVSFSGDKLLGGPQAGIVIGSKLLIDRLKRHPLARVLRLDKMTLAALEATLRLYLDPDRARVEIPTLAMLEADSDEVRARAERVAAAIREYVAPEDALVEVVEDAGCAGGGALPTRDIPSWAVRVQFLRGSAQSCDSFLTSENPTPIIGRISHGAMLFNLLTVLGAAEEQVLVRALATYFSRKA